MKNLHYGCLNFSSSSSHIFFTRLYTNLKDIIPEAQSLIKYLLWISTTVLTSSSAQRLGTANDSKRSAPQSNFTVGGLDPRGEKNLFHKNKNYFEWSEIWKFRKVVLFYCLINLVV